MWHCLSDMDIEVYHARQLQLNHHTLELLKSDERLVVCGHIHYMQSAKTDAQIAIKREILKILYFKSDLIMPTRNPSNLLQSWMHYSKTRSNKILQDRHSSTKQIKGNDGGMLRAMSALKQNCLLFSEDGKKAIGKGDDYPYIKLREENEEHNLLAFADFLMTGEDTLSQLCAMQFVFFWLDWKEILGAYKKNQTVKIANLPTTSNERKILYYDCENIDSAHQYELDQMVCPGFSERLLNTRKNASEDKNEVKGSDFDSVNKKLQNVIPAEWQIYAMSKGDG